MIITYYTYNNTAHDNIEISIDTLFVSFKEKYRVHHACLSSANNQWSIEFEYQWILALWHIYVPQLKITLGNFQQYHHMIFIVMWYDALHVECRRHLSALCHANQLPTSLQICINRQVGYFCLYTWGIYSNTQHVFV